MVRGVGDGWRLNYLFPVIAYFYNDSSKSSKPSLTFYQLARPSRCMATTSPHKRPVTTTLCTLLCYSTLRCHFGRCRTINTMHCRFCALLPYVFHPHLSLAANYNLCDIFTTRNHNMPSTCRTAGRYATPAALCILLTLYDGGPRRYDRPTYYDIVVPSDATRWHARPR